MAGPGLGAGRDDVLGDLGQWPGAEHLRFAAKIGAPPDLQALGVEPTKAAFAVQHDDKRLFVLGKAGVAQLTPGGDANGAPHGVERDGMRGGEGLDCGDAGHDAQARMRIKPRRDANGAVVKRWVAPDQQGHRAGWLLGAKRGAPAAGDLVMPCADAFGIGQGGITLRVLEGADFGGRFRRREDAIAQGGKRVLVFALQRQKDHGGIAQGLHALKRDMGRAAGADPDQPEIFDHGGIPLTIDPGRA